MSSEAIEAIAQARAIIIGAGAGMGVDSGLPDFRGPEGFWNAYPVYKKLNLDFASVANPLWFRRDPELAWGFYGHRLNLYRGTKPHDGFQILRKLAGRVKHGAFVFTSNVDGHFQKAGFDAGRVWEVHGTIHSMQCVQDCGVGIFPSSREPVTVDPETLRAKTPLPECPRCHKLARPNILMFGDGEWDARHSDSQQARFADWLHGVDGGLLVIELGAGVAVPTVRSFSQQMAKLHGARIIRINLRESDVPKGHIAMAMGALQALTLLDA